MLYTRQKSKIKQQENIINGNVTYVSKYSVYY